MAHVEFDKIDSLITSIGMDLDVLAGTFGHTIREVIAQRLRDRTRTLRGILATDITVMMTGDNRSRISINIRDELDDTVKQAIRNEFEKIMHDIGAVAEGKSMSGPPASGLTEILERA